MSGRGREAKAAGPGVAASSAGPPAARAAFQRPCCPAPAPAANDVFASRTGRGGEHIPHVECVSQTLLHVHQWDPNGEAEILIFGRPYYQQDVSKMIMNLANYHRHPCAATRMGTMKGTQAGPGFWEKS